MNIYIWNAVGGLTDNYHDGGGCAVIAASIEDARAQLPADCGAQNQVADFIAPIDYPDVKTFIFPDAGCC